MDKGISIAIPTFDKNGKEAEFVKFSLDQIQKQTFKDFEVVISDDSDNDNIKNIISNYNFNIKYYKSKDIALSDREFKKGNSPNVNRAMKKCSKEIIQILFQDDFLRSKNTLQKIFETFEQNNCDWSASSFYETKDGITASRTVKPVYTERIYLGENTMSGPSIISVKNREDLLLFDEHLIVLMDCDYYKRLADKYGYPQIINFFGIVIRQHAGQITNNQGAEPELIQREIEYCKSKFKKNI
jgi:glycosyltransferase involved in cell wall biosynthesis